MDYLRRLGIGSIMGFEKRIPGSDRSSVYSNLDSTRITVDEPMKNHSKMAIEPLNISAKRFCIWSVIKPAKIHFPPDDQSSGRSRMESAESAFRDVGLSFQEVPAAVSFHNVIYVPRERCETVVDLGGHG
jgi:hypothetical protein